VGPNSRGGGNRLAPTVNISVYLRSVKASAQPIPESEAQLASISLDASIVHRPYIRQRAVSAPSELTLARAEARRGECGNAHDLCLDKEVASSTSPKSSVANDHQGLLSPEAVQKVSDASLRIDNVVGNEPGSANSNCDHRIPALSPTQGPLPPALS